METIKKVSVNGQVYNLGGSSAVEPIEITYSELKALKDSSGLVPGQKYKITDYETIIKNVEIAIDTQIPRVKSANHRFDLTVTANSTNSFEALAKASKNKDDSYFNTSNLDAWTIYYCFDNDTNYPVDDNCKGYIYKMVDEYNNEANFDFKNVLMAVGGNTVHNIVDSMSSSTDKSADYVYFYLFSYALSKSTNDIQNSQDASVLGFAKNNIVNIPTSFNSIQPVNKQGCVLLVIKGILPITSFCIVDNIINSASTFIFCYSSTIANINNNKVEGGSLLISNICGLVKNNLILNNAVLGVGIQNWEQESHNHVMGDIVGNFLYPGSTFYCYGTSKNGVKFEENIIYTAYGSSVNCDFNIIKCKIEGSFPYTSVLDSESEEMYILGNGTDSIRKVAIYDIGN